MDNGITAGIVIALVGVIASAFIAREAAALRAVPAHRGTMIVLLSYSGSLAMLGLVVAVLAASQSGETSAVALVAPVAALVGAAIMVAAARGFAAAANRPGPSDAARMRASAVSTAALGQGIAILGTVLAMLAIFGVFG